MHLVYKITNTINKKVYIGMTGRTLEQRWKSHLVAARQGSPFRFHSAIRKYGPDPWVFECLFKSESILEVRLFEEKAIVEHLSQINGYNAKPGGCGGWIVPAEKQESWKIKNTRRAQGSTNSNALSITNEEMINIALAFTKEFGFIPGMNRFRKYGEDLGFKMPKSYQKYRFNGSHKNLAAEVEIRTGLKYDPFYRDDIQKGILAQKNIGKRWFHNDNLQKSLLSSPGLLSSDWILGRKKYD